jgi:hypothetical protein
MKVAHPLWPPLIRGSGQGMTPWIKDWWSPSTCGTQGVASSRQLWCARVPNAMTYVMWCLCDAEPNDSSPTLGRDARHGVDRGGKLSRVDEWAHRAGDVDVVMGLLFDMRMHKFKPADDVLIRCLCDDGGRVAMPHKALVENSRCS